jgi:hypothetical protein
VIWDVFSQLPRVRHEKARWERTSKTLSLNPLLPLDLFISRLTAHPRHPFIAMIFPQFDRARTPHKNRLARALFSQKSISDRRLFEKE